MPLYNVAQVGGTLVALSPGDSMKLFDGTETPSAGLKSVAFNRAIAPNMLPAPLVFTVNFPLAPSGSSVQIQGSNDDVDGHYQTLSTISTQNGYYADLGEFNYYRAVLATYSSGGMPVVFAC
jgi:hypothetical protein